MATPTDQSRPRDRITGATLARMIGFVRRTSGDPPGLRNEQARLIASHPAIIAIWHGQFMMIPAYCPPEVKVRIMIARHGDAELFAETLKHFDMELIRGAGAGNRKGDRGGTHALRAALTALEAGYSVPMTADVPPGPARVAGLGIVTLARLSGRPIIPVAIATSRFRALNTWSRMTINMPFSKAGVVVGEPIHVPRETTADALERYRLDVETALNTATREAYRRAGADPRRATPGPSFDRALGPPAPGAALATYRGIMTAGRLAAPAVLGIRTRQGKEIAARRNERYGIASAARPAGQLVWFHAASVGETNAVLPVIDEMTRARPALQFLLTTGTVTSAKLAAERLGPNARHQFAPLDVPSYVKSFLDHWRPDLGVFVESEIWPNLILESAYAKIPLALVNARMSKRSFRRWRGRRGLAEPLFGRLDLVLSQNPNFARQYLELGAQTAEAVGNLKIDAPPQPINAQALADLKVAIGDRPVLLAASTHEGEEAILADAYRDLAATVVNPLLIIAPRHPERATAILQALKARGFTVAQRSAGEVPSAATQIYLADTMGELGTLYALSPVAFIGKSLVPEGGQNPIEAVRHGAVVLTGPSYFNFQDATSALIDAGGAIVVRDATELAANAARLLRDLGACAAVDRKAQATLATMTGALAKTTAALLALLPPDGGPARGA